jgi:hypothetical protein
MYMGGSNHKDIVNQEPGFYLVNRVKCHAFHQEMAVLINAKAKIPWSLVRYSPGTELPSGQPTDLNGEIFLTSEQKIRSWLECNILVKSRPFKKKQLYIYGATNLGKSSLIEKLRPFLRIYQIPYEDFYDFYNDRDWDLAVLDEFKAQKSVSWLNMWLQGSEMAIRYKGAQGLKRYNIPTIILSNFTLEECYVNTPAHILDTLRSRLEIVEVTRFLDIIKDVHLESIALEDGSLVE